MPEHLPLSRLSPYARIVHDFPTGGFTLSNRYINDHALLYFKKGSGEFQYGRETYAIASGTLFFVRPNTPHGFICPPTAMYMLNMHFDPIESPQSAARHYLQLPPAKNAPPPDECIALDAPEAPPVCLRLRRPAIYERLFFRAHALFSLRDAASRIQMKAALLDLLAQVFAEARTEASSPALRAQLPALFSAVQYMQERFHTPISHSEAAAEAGMSPSYFARCFKQHYQVSPIRFLAELRMEKAKTELTLTAQPVKAIAAAVGYKSVHHFTRAFTRYAGQAPAQYRAANQPAG